MQMDFDRECQNAMVSLVKSQTQHLAGVSSFFSSARLLFLFLHSENGLNFKTQTVPRIQMENLASRPVVLRSWS